MKKSNFAQATVKPGVWKLAPNDVWNVPDDLHEVRFDIETRGPWQLLSKLQGLAVEPGGKVWGWRTLAKPHESGYAQEGTVSVGGARLRAFTSSQLFERPDGSLCSVAVLYVCRPKS